jgi:hypothetical protein
VRVNATPESLDALAADLVARHGYSFTVATDDAGREAAYRLRYLATVEQGWRHENGATDGREHDAYDESAVHIVGWHGQTAISTGRLVLPPGPLPTEEICGIVIEPRGRVVDVGRMTVARSYQGPAHPAFVALLARLYLEVRHRGYEVACGLMAARARSLLRLLGVRVEVLGADRPFWGEMRAPVRFTVSENAVPLADRWG